jgi:hypothetical protein
VGGGEGRGGVHSVPSKYRSQGIGEKYDFVCELLGIEGKKMDRLN